MSSTTDRIGSSGGNMESAGSMASMTPESFRLWRRQLGLSQKDAAELLGLKRRMVQYYEKGEREGEPVEIPLGIRLACWALSRGVVDYAGPKSGPIKDDKLKRRAKRTKDRDAPAVESRPGPANQSSRPEQPSPEEPPSTGDPDAA